MRRLKYGHLMVELAECPPASAHQASRTCYRFVKDPLDCGSFIPVALCPDRPVNHPGPETTPCAELALSMFTTSEQARKKFTELIKKHPVLPKRIGTHLAELRLEPAHGLQTIPSRTGHFDLHEFEGVDLVKVATLVGPL